MVEEYCGWIPTITGNLSFSVLGSSASNALTHRDYRKLQDRRYTLAVQERVTSDSIFQIHDRLSDKEPSFFFVLLSVSFEHQQHDINNGLVYIVDRREFWRVRYRLDALETCDNCDFERSFQFANTSLDDLVAKGVAAKVFARLDRKGKVTLRTNIPSGAMPHPGTLENQAFYFLRDISHRHQHHQPTSDTIVKCYGYDEASDVGRQRWKRETLYALYRWVIQQKRTQSLGSYINCMGVVAYARSFETLHVDREVDLHVPQYNAERTIDSLEAASKSLISNPGSRFWQAFLGQAMPVLSLIVALFGVVAERFGGFDQSGGLSPQMELLHVLFRLIHEFPLVPIAVGFSPVVYVLFAGFVRRHLVPRSRTLQRISISIGFWKTLLVLFLCFVFLVSYLVFLLTDFNPLVFFLGFDPVVEILTGIERLLTALR